MGTNEELVGEALQPCSDKVLIAKIRTLMSDIHFIDSNGLQQTGKAYYHLCFWIKARKVKKAPQIESVRSVAKLTLFCCRQNHRYKCKPGSYEHKTESASLCRKALPLSLGVLHHLNDVSKQMLLDYDLPHCSTFTHNIDTFGKTLN